MFTEEYSRYTLLMQRNKYLNSILVCYRILKKFVLVLCGDWIKEL